MFERYNHKIKTVDELTAAIGPRPRDVKVAMCHGTFDVVHPGHIRHLIHAKSTADVLIASLTADEFISKGVGRPWVPEELRAANLAALEMVDYVLIDRQGEPLDNISTIKPDFFVKGFEYSQDGVHPKSRQEMDLVSSYGGEFLFSPGDIVYSSTRLLVQHRPNIAAEKVLALMDAEDVSFDQLIATIDSMGDASVHVVGDTIVDKYSYCTILGPSGKTPTFSVRHDKSELFVGGAGAVAQHLASLGADVTFTTMVGEDELSGLVRTDLADAGVQVNAVVDRARPTTMKQRFWADGYKLLQVDELDNSPLNEIHIDEICGHIADSKNDAIVFSDFRHGMFHAESIARLSAAIPDGVLKAADSQVSNRWGNILDFQGFDLITPNEGEGRFALGDQDSGVRSLALRLLEGANARNMIMTLGERGVLAYRRSSTAPRSFFYLDSFANTLVDAVGAGDALLSAATLALKSSGSLVEAAIIGEAAAAAACEIDGNIPVERDDIKRRLADLLDPMAAGSN